MSTFELPLTLRGALRSLRPTAAAVLLLLCGHLSATLPMAAQATASSRPAATATTGTTGANQTTAPLRQEIESRYEVLPLSDGVVLRPRTERSGVRSIEVNGSSIAVNGARVSREVLRAWVGEDAGPLLKLLDLTPPERRALFGLSGSAESSADSSGASADSSTDPGDEEVDSGEPADSTPTELPSPSDVPSPPAPPEPPDSESKWNEDADVHLGTIVRFTGNARVDANEEAEQVVVIGGSAAVDGAVREEVSAIGGDVRINGRVGGDVTSVGGDVRLGPKAEIDGDVTSVGGTVEREPGAKVHGQINEAAGIGPGIHIGGGRDRDFWPWWGPFAGAMRLMWSILTLALLALLVAVTVVVGREPVARVEAKLASDFWLAGLAGLLSQLLFIPLFVLVTVVLVVSIIGIPLLILYPFLFLALILGGLVGFSAFSLRVGRLIEHRFDRRFGSAVATALVGLFTIEVCRIFGKLLHLGSGPLDAFGWFFSLTGFLIAYAAWTFGFGGVVLTRFAMGPRRSRGGNDLPPDPYEAPLAPVPPLPPIAPVDPGVGVERFDSVDPIDAPLDPSPTSLPEEEPANEPAEEAAPKPPTEPAG